MGTAHIMAFQPLVDLTLPFTERRLLQRLKGCKAATAILQLGAQLIELLHTTAIGFALGLQRHGHALKLFCL